jgi:SAM-dependent methyltransferase
MLQHSHYKNLVEKAAPGTHRQAWELLRTAHVAKDCQVLDLAAGNGAFASRFVDAGFPHVSVTELAPKPFPFEAQAIYQWDLNENFASLTDQKYDLITAIEIIEHLDSPLHFLRQIHALLHEGGFLLLTTPNVQNIISRFKFLLTGELKSFSPQDFIDQRHIHGITDHQLKIFFDIVGFELISQNSAGSFYGPLKKALLRPLYWFSRLLKGHLAEGDVNIYLVRKSRAKANLGDSLAHYLHVATEISS